MATGKQQFDGYYLISSDCGKGLKMVLEGPWKAKYAESIGKNNIAGLRLSVSNGWCDTDTSFIKKLSEITELEIYSWGVTNISSIGSLPQLEHISLECNYRKSIDFTAFTNLQSCFLRWRPKSDSIFSVTSLKALNIVNYPYENLIPLQKLTGLTELKLTSSKLKHLEGINKLGSLASLDLYRCTKLESLDGIQRVDDLKIIELESCKKIENLQPLGSLIKLTKVLLNNCGKVQSLLPLTSCNRLSEVFFIEDTNIVDGNIDIFLHLPLLKTMWFANRNHYSHKREEVLKTLEARLH